MTLEVSDLDPVWQPKAIAYLRRAPYRNAIPLSHLTQLRHNCDVVVAHSRGTLQGVATHHHDLPFLGVTFVAELGQSLPSLLNALSERVPALRSAIVTAVLPEHRVQQLADNVRISATEYAWQMVVEPETFKVREHAHIQRLSNDNIPAMTELAQLCQLVDWRPDTLAYGPAFGAFQEGQLIAMATTHFATTDVIEIGSIATHPHYRHQGDATACVSALAQVCFSLAPRVYILVMIDNSRDYEAYRLLGFWPVERFAFVQFYL